MDFGYFKDWCKDKWGDIKACFWCIGIIYEIYANRFNIFLTKHNVIKVLTEYEVSYLGVTVVSILVYDKLRKHYDNISYRVDVLGELSNVSDNIRMYNIRLESKHSFIKTFFKQTFR